MISHEWKIERLYSDSVNGKPDVVHAIDWRVFSLDESAPVNIYGRTYVEYNDQNTFISYSSLSESQVIDWIRLALGNEEFNSILDNLEKKAEWYRNEVAKSNSLPW